MKNQLKCLDFSKLVHETDIKNGCFSPFLLNYFNFPKPIEISKCDSRPQNRNNRPVSVPSNISKVLENILNQQIIRHLEKKFSKQEN